MSISTRQRDGRPYYYTLIDGKQRGLGFDKQEAQKNYRALHNSIANDELPDHTIGKLVELSPRQGRQVLPEGR